MDERNGVEITREGKTAIVDFKATSISDVEGIADARAMITAFVERERPNKLIFDFSTVKFFCSQVLGLLLETRSKLREYDGEVVISAIDPQLHRIFKITNLDKIFRFFPDKQSALKAISVE